jgi:hypothetical protein
MKAIGDLFKEESAPTPTPTPTPNSYS